MAGIVCCEIAVKHKVAGIVSVGPICPGPETKEAFEHRVAVVQKGETVFGKSAWVSKYTDRFAEGVEGIVNSVDIPSRATGSAASRTAEAFVRSLIQSSDAKAYETLSQAIASASVPEYGKITCPLLCVAGQEDQVARLEDLALIGDRHVFPTHQRGIHLLCNQPFRTAGIIIHMLLLLTLLLLLQLGSTVQD